MTGTGQTALNPTRGLTWAHRRDRSCSLATAQPAQASPPPDSAPASPLSDGGSGSVASLPPGKCSRRRAFPCPLDGALNYVSHKADQALGPPFCVTRQVVGGHVGSPVPSPPPAWVAWGRRAEVDGRGGGVADATARTILEPAWREGRTPPTRGLL